MAVRTNYFRAVVAVLALALAATLLGLAAPTAKADDTNCTGALTGTFDNVVVPEGATCVLSNSLVRGNVKALPDSSLTSDSNIIRGNVEGDKADDIFIFSTTGPSVVGGNIQAKEGDIGVAVCGTRLPNGNIQIEKFDASLGIIVGGQVPVPGVPACGAIGGGNVLEKGNIKVEENRIGIFGLDVSNNRVAQNLQVFKNRGGALRRVQSNQVGENLQCFENQQPFVGSPNTAGKAEEQCF